MKSCSWCGTAKEESAFYLRAGTEQPRSQCKACDNERSRQYMRTHYKQPLNRNKAYKRTQRGFVVKVYHDMRARVEGRKKDRPNYAGLPILPRRVFYAWALQNEDLRRLLNEYKASGYTLKLAPSIDRIDPKRGYVLDNIRFVTQSENSRKARLDERKAA